MPVVILHYHEIWLKGCNRKFFIHKLRVAVEQALDGLPVRSTTHEDCRMLVELDSQQAGREAVQRLQRTPGIAYLALSEQTQPELEAIVETGARQMREASFRTFSVRARRAIKSLPFRSTDIERELGQRINDEAARAGRSVKVDLENPEATCFVEVTQNRALLYREKIAGVGGLPTGTAGRLACLLSGGFDSAVAAYKIIRRGVRLTFIHFHGPPARPGEDSPPIVREIVRALTPYQGRSRLSLVPFGDLQRQIVLAAPEEFRLLLYRRFMLRIAEKLAGRRHALGLVTGDSVAQVASQTLQNMQAVTSVARMPLYRPVIGDDKREILDLARQIGTYEISCEPFTDCCPRFLPRNPRIFCSPEQLDEAESRLSIEELVSRCVSESQTEIYEYRGGAVRQIARKQNESRTTPISIVAR